MGVDTLSCAVSISTGGGGAVGACEVISWMAQLPPNGWEGWKLDKEQKSLPNRSHGCPTASSSARKRQELGLTYFLRGAFLLTRAYREDRNVLSRGKKKTYAVYAAVLPYMQWHQRGKTSVCSHFFVVIVSQTDVAVSPLRLPVLKIQVFVTRLFQ